MGWSDDNQMAAAKRLEIKNLLMVIFKFEYVLVGTKVFIITRYTQGKY
jgi:hypothetical protein